MKMLSLTDVSDPEKLAGKLGTRESLTKKYGFDIIDLSPRLDDEATEDASLRCLKHKLILEGGSQAVVLRRSKEHFIHEVRKLGVGNIGNAFDIIFEIIEYNQSINRLVVYMRLPCNYINQRISPMYGLDIVWGKCEVENEVKIFWDHRGVSHQFTINKDNTIGCMKKADVVLGCNQKGELILVRKDDVLRRLVFKDLFKSLVWRLNHRLSSFRMNNLTSLKKAGFMKDWTEPGTSERKMPGRMVAMEMMGRVIHEVLNFGEGDALVPGDGYFGSRIDRCSQHHLELTNRNDKAGGTIELTFTSDMFEKCVIKINTKCKAIQYIASEFFEVNLDIAYPLNLMFDITKDKPQNSHFIHHVLCVDISADADSAKDDPSLPVFFERVILDDKDVKYIRDFNMMNNTQFSECGYFIKWIAKVEHAFDVTEAKIVDQQPILLYWNHRGRNQIFCLEERQQTLHPVGAFELAWGYNSDTLKLVSRDSLEVLKFSDLSTFLQKKNPLDAGRMKEIATMSRDTTEWQSPMVIAYGILGAMTETAALTK